MGEQSLNQYRTLQELDDRMASIRSELGRIDKIDDPTEEDLDYQGTLITEHDQLDAKAQPIRQRMADLERVRKAAQDPASREEPPPRKAPEMFVRGSRDPLEDIDRVRQNLVTRDELRARSLDLIELDSKRWDLPHDHAEQATVRSQSSPAIARHVLLTGSQDYRNAFRAYLENPSENEHRMRAINLTNASGGYLLPYVLDPTIILSNAASANPYRRVSRVVTTTSNAWQGVNSAGVNAALVAEAATAADSAPSDFGQVQVVPKKFAAWVLGTYEALDDTDFGVQLPGLLSDAKDRIESAYFSTGSGTNAPLGVIPAFNASARVAPSTTGTAFNGSAAIPDIYHLQAALPPRFRQSKRAAFMANIAVLNGVRALDLYGGGSFWANLTSDTPPSLLGQPVYEASDMSSTLTGTSAASGTANSTLVFADFNNFIIADRLGISMIYDPMIKGTGSAAQLPAGEAGWYMFWRVGSNVGTTAAFRFLTIS